MRNFLIDTDTASDDAVAIMMALADPKVRVLGLTTVAGNVGLEQATRNALLTAEVCHSDVPVFAGADKPLTRAHDHAHWFHGKDGLGDRGFPAPKRKQEREHAVDAILRLAQEEPGLTLVTLGPLTNIALALKRDPKLAERIGRCVVMGGAPCCEGNVTPAAEYNIWVDPEAARAVFRSKLNIEMVGWHVSRGASVLNDDEIAAIEALGTAKAKFAIESNMTAREAYRVQTGEIGLSLADPTAMAVALDRSIGLSWSRHRVAIETGSRAHPRHDGRRPPQRAPRREQRPCLARGDGRARGRRCALDPRLAPVQGYAESRAGGLKAAGEGSQMESGRNLLGQETSPYLLQHAGNPVHWRPWSAEALAEAKRRDCPILLSIGYAACHWCHVMAHESFENAETARLMNELFVNIKVDREERPDIDHIYMTALHALGQQGGWPLTMFLTPDGKPMIGGTYWPPEPRYGRPSFRQVLHSIDSAWRTQRDQMESRGLTLADHLAKLSELNAGPGVSPADLTRVGDALRSAVDPVHGGLSGAPKFPNAPIFRFFWNEMFRRGDPSFGEALRAMLEAMNAGGIYDHLGGGYARYSTDAEWLVPHFEKMLYDNAQILELLALVHSLWPDPTFAERARETVGWLMREMRVGDAFAASLDADQDGEEGLFYVWDEEEVDAALGDAARRFKAAYDVTRGGNWEDRTVLRRITPRGSPEEEAGLAASRAKLFALREARPKPGRDDKVLADWNGLTSPRSPAPAQCSTSRRGFEPRAPRSISSWRSCAALTAGSCMPGARDIPAPALCSTITRRWPAPRLAYSKRAASQATSKPRAALRARPSICSATARAGSSSPRATPLTCPARVRVKRMTARRLPESGFSPKSSSASGI